MAEPNLRLAYLFWIPSFFGCAGLHRFYLGKPVSGLFYFFTFGFFGLGTLYDGLTMPHHVRQARLSRRLDRILENQGSEKKRARRFAERCDAFQTPTARVARPRHSGARRRAPRRRYPVARRPCGPDFAREGARPARYAGRARVCRPPSHPRRADRIRLSRVSR